jgi:hypothetical protein
MVPSLSQLAVLNALQLEYYAGNTNLGSREEWALYHQLHSEPVQVETVTPTPLYAPLLKGIVSEIAKKSRYSSFKELKLDVFQRTSLIINNPLDLGSSLTVLFGGIYIGDPEDVRNFFHNPESSSLYPVKGLGSKVINVVFIDRSAH